MDAQVSRAHGCAGATLALHHHKRTLHAVQLIFLGSKLFESFPDLRKKYWGRHFWARGYFCVTSGELTEEMIKDYLEHHFEPKVDDNFRTEL
jgi:putative transposase